MKTARIPALVALATLLSLALVVTAALPTSLAAQSTSAMSKKERKKLEKEWKAKAKAFAKQPLSLRDNQDYFKKKIDELNKLIAERDLKISEQEQKLTEFDALKASNTALQSERDEAVKRANEAAQNQARGVEPGLVFKVQIGAFRHFNLQKYLSETREMRGDQQEDMTKYTLGTFRDLETAEAFRKDIRRMGIRDAFVVGYRDGVRIDMKPIRDAAKGSKQPSKPKP